jgi:hypothetical protein
MLAAQQQRQLLQQERQQQQRAAEGGRAWMRCWPRWLAGRRLLNKASHPLRRQLLLRGVANRCLPAVE